MHPDTSATTPAPLNALGTFLRERQRAAGKSDDEVAAALGFSSTKVYAMILTGQMKLPLAKIPAAARLLQAHEVDVLRAVLEAYCGAEMVEAIDKVWGTSKLTEQERTLLRAYRELAAEHDFELKVLGAQHVVALITA